ncbi:O-antigen ligase family protein [Pseudarthrobacter sulfonivorans]|uniref:O-antigen ligase family protein n=1 Tax=Pseudarthrobacter sulfonivorans TaxID=121292 RepID=UPI00277E7BD0|nr:O-antigen ligase family protein [Pseudarthrobacter sulfonivorans]MDQ0000526.1 O-antigen ligase [Pseudarthrobacter sulfonivorans]
MGILENLLIVVLSILALTILATHKNGSAITAFLVGVSAGLVAVQVFRVHVFTIMVLVWVLQRRRTFNVKGFNRALLMSVPVGLMAVTSVLGDLVNSDTLVFQLLGLAVTAMLLITYSTPEDRRNIIGGLLAVTTVSSIVGLLQVAKVVPIETWHASISSVGRPIGIYPEPDWLGMFAGVGLVLAWRLPLRRWLRIVAVAANAAALVLAFARAAWIAFGVAVLVVVILEFISKRKRQGVEPRRGRFGAALLLGVASAGVLLFLPQLVIDLSNRLSRTLQVQDDDISGQARVRQFDALMRLADIAPFYGHGLSSSGRVGVWGQIITMADTPNNVASNWLLAMWVDGKWLAVPLILLLVFTATRYCRTISGQALVLVLLSSLFSNATFFPVTWALLALCLAEAVPTTTTDEMPRAGMREGPMARRGTLTVNRT